MMAVRLSIAVVPDSLKGMSSLTGRSPLKSYISVEPIFVIERGFRLLGPKASLLISAYDFPIPPSHQDNQSTIYLDPRQKVLLSRGQRIYQARYAP